VSATRPATHLERYTSAVTDGAATAALSASDARRETLEAGTGPAVVAPQQRVAVSMLASLPPAKGVSPYTSHLVSALAARRDVALEAHAFRAIYPRGAYPGGDPDDAGAPMPAFDGVEVHRDLSWRNPLGWLRTGFGLRGEVVHAQWWSYALAPVYLTVLGVARLRRKRIVMTVHNVAAHEDAFWKRVLHRAVLKLSHRYIVHSEANAAALRPLVGERAVIDVVPHGVLDTPRRGVPRSEARAALGIPGGARVVLCFGHIRPYKGIDVLLRAFAEVAREHPDAWLLIAGQPWVDWAPYAALIDQLGVRERVVTDLRFIPTDDVERYIVAADVVALPYTRFDAQTGVGTRALPFGKPLVVTATGGLPELVRDPDAVVPPGDAAALARALARVLGDRDVAEQMAADSLAIAATLGWERIAATTAAIYADAAGVLPLAADDGAALMVEARR